MTSKLYEEAIADSKKLKSLLREEVEKDLIEKINEEIIPTNYSLLNDLANELSGLFENNNAPVIKIPKATSVRKKIKKPSKRNNQFNFSY